MPRPDEQRDRCCDQRLVTQNPHKSLYRKQILITSSSYICRLRAPATKRKRRPPSGGRFRFRLVARTTTPQALVVVAKGIAGPARPGRRGRGLAYNHRACGVGTRWSSPKGCDNVNPAWVAIVDESSPQGGDDIGHSPTRSKSAMQGTLGAPTMSQSSGTAANGGRRGRAAERRTAQTSI